MKTNGNGNGKTPSVMEECNTPELSNTKTTRFLDDEYPTLHSGAFRDSKGFSISRNPSKTSNLVAKSGKLANDINVPYDSEGHTVSENESASEWETDDEESLLAQSRIETEKELVMLNAELESLNCNAASHIEVKGDSQQLKSILRRNSNKPCTELKGKIKIKSYKIYSSL